MCGCYRRRDNYYRNYIVSGYNRYPNYPNFGTNPFATCIRRNGYNINGVYYAYTDPIGMVRFCL